MAGVTDELEIREARASDADLLREWRNDPQTREASGSTDPVDAVEHAEWLERLLADPDRFLWIAAIGGRPAGQVRLERRRGFEYEISVSVDAELRGSGIGPAIIRSGCELLWTRTNATRIVARVRDENIASAGAFAAAGFRRHGSDGDGFRRLVLDRRDEWAPARPPAPMMRTA